MDDGPRAGGLDGGEREEGWAGTGWDNWGEKKYKK